jgi:hypothetical protein
MRATRVSTPSSACLVTLADWRTRLALQVAGSKKPRGGDSMKESAYLADFMRDIFISILGYRRDVEYPEFYTFARENHNPVDNKYADAVLGRFNSDHYRVTAVIEGKRPSDPLDRPHAGRKKSAVDQAYLYAVNLRCDWIIVTGVSSPADFEGR